jgi:hypothetical protein
VLKGRKVLDSDSEENVKNREWFHENNWKEDERHWEGTVLGVSTWVVRF